MKMKFVPLVLSLLVFCDAQSQEMQLAPIRLQMFVPTNHLAKPWGGGVVRNNPANFDFFLEQEGKGKTFGITTHTSKEESFDIDLEHVEKALVAGGCTNIHKEFITFLGRRCCKLGGEYPAQAFIPKRNTMFYVFYAQGLCYKINASVLGMNPMPPEKDPDIHELLASMAFMSH